ncbi:hypothetical protein HPB49_015055 [Dermacentor silvarum]|uniref:Uncharacterized protein n=1 Tax=Dermacentor silvarum TaxID=543639 RepID=A0ACB8D6P6_DERSI|nr:hypothetical protein HPB49_015055 [Dermacentor silvarum]
MPRQRREKTDDQIAAEKRRRADARRLKRAQETSEQRAERLAQDRESRRTRRQQDTDQVRDARIVSDREAKRAYRAAEETPEARAERVIKGRQAQRKRWETETPEDDAQRRGKDREAKRARHQWETFFSTYTNGTYGGSDYIYHQGLVAKMLLELFESKSVGENGLRYLVAWSIYRQLVTYTVPTRLFGNRPLNYRHVQKTCYELVGKVMNLAVKSPYFRSQPYPDARQDRLFPTWIKALSLSSHYIWADQTTLLYDEETINAYYIFDFNTLVIPPGIIQRPFFYPYGPLGLNYGGLGAIVAHEIMHAFDVKGITVDEAQRSWISTDIIKEYTKRALCLRQSHRSVESGGHSLPRHGFLKDDTKEGRDHVWIILPFICLLVVVLGVSCSIFLITSMISEQSPGEAIITGDTLATFHVKTKTTPDIERAPEEQELWSPPTPVSTSPAPARIVPPRPTSHSEVCTSFLCRYAGQWLRSKIDHSANPCKDFYRFVCGSFRGYDEFSHDGHPFPFNLYHYRRHRFRLTCARCTTLSSVKNVVLYFRTW